MMPKFIPGHVVAFGLIATGWLLTPAVAQTGSETPASQTPEQTAATCKLPKLRTELSKRVAKDQAARMAMIEGMKRGANGKTKINTEAHDLLASVDKENKAWLLKQVAAHGWLGKSLVGEKGAHDAWLLVQHADQDLPFQKKCLQLMSAMPEGEVAAVDIAYLTDRTLTAEGKKQRYGTQCTIEDGKAVVQQVEDPENLNRRRAELGMDPIEKYLKFVEEMYVKPAPKPSP